MEMIIRHEQNVRIGVFYVNSQCERKAFLSYLENPEGVLVLNHTFVSPDLRGKNVAAILVQTAIAYARKNMLKIRPVCTYVVSYFEKHPEENDVLVK